MYSLKEGWLATFGVEPVEQWEGKMMCMEVDAAITFHANETRGFLAAYTFTLVTEGWTTVVYNGKELTLQADDLMIYSPGMTIIVIAASENYRGLCLLVDEHVTLETPAVRDLVSIAYMPIVQLHEPKLSLPDTAARHLAAKLREIIRYMHSDNIYKKEILRMLYAVFLLDLQNVQQKSVARSQTPQRMEEIFIGFIRLLPLYFVAHHDIAFYAEKLHISPVYLSRIVRQVTGRTVVGYINQMLLMEASFLLRTSSMSITQIADYLHFSDTPSFSKFFLRLKGVSPREYREGKMK